MKDKTHEVIMEVHTVNSSTIDEMSHDGRSTMIVKFKNGRTYQYNFVVYEIFECILNAPSVGKALHASGHKGVEI
jgi:hypothetical protein